MTARLVTCGASGVDEKRADWVPLDPGEEPSEGARLAVVGGANGVTVLLVELEAEGFIAEHATPEVSVCHVIEGDGTVFLPGGEEISFERGDTIEFAGGVPHGWRGGNDRVLVAVTTYPAS
jgi:quercetin dioxygenase-like cupin family protein